MLTALRKLAFALSAKTKTFTSYRKKMTKSIAIQDCVLVCLLFLINNISLGLCPRQFIYLDRYNNSRTDVLVCLYAAHQQRFLLIYTDNPDIIHHWDISAGRYIQ